jgi:hypothetical protein
MRSVARGARMTAFSLLCPSAAFLQDRDRGALLLMLLR